MAKKRRRAVRGNKRSARRSRRRSRLSGTPQEHDAGFSAEVAKAIEAFEDTKQELAKSIIDKQRRNGAACATALDMLTDGMWHLGAAKAHHENSGLKRSAVLRDLTNVGNDLVQDYVRDCSRYE